MVECDKRTCHYEDADKGCTYFDCDDCKYFYKEKENNMTEQEAIEEFNRLKITRIFIPHDDSIDMAIKALGKQIPKKWQYEMLNDDDTYVCPCCKEYWHMEYGNPTTNEYNYCPNCGQALEWE